MHCCPTISIRNSCCSLLPPSSCNTLLKISLLISAILFVGTGLAVGGFGQTLAPQLFSVAKVRLLTGAILGTVGIVCALLALYPNSRKTSSKQAFPELKGNFSERKSVKLIIEKHAEAIALHKIMGTIALIGKRSLKDLIFKIETAKDLLVAYGSDSDLEKNVKNKFIPELAQQNISERTLNQAFKSLSTDQLSNIFYYKKETRCFYYNASLVELMGLCDNCLYFETAKRERSADFRCVEIPRGCDLFFKTSTQELLLVVL